MNSVLNCMCLSKMIIHESTDDNNITIIHDFNIPAAIEDSVPVGREEIC